MILKNIVFPLLTTAKELEEILRKYDSSQAPLVIDTEFMRISTYWPRFGLLQLGFEDQFFAIDPLKIENYQPLTDIFADPRIVKVIHSSYQDMEIFYKYLGCLPQNVFDTQIAAQFCGFGPSVSYETLVQRYCGAELDKSSQFTNWLQRPLTESQLLYALNDVKYLGGVYRGIIKDLNEKRYLEWALEEMVPLQNPSYYQIDQDEIWRKIKINVHNPEFLARVQALAREREVLARERDKPRRHIIKDDLLTLIAQENPLLLSEFCRNKKELNRGIDQKIIISLQAALESINHLEPENYPRLPNYQKLSNARKERIKHLKELLLKVSEETGIAASLIAKSKEIEGFVRHPLKKNKIMEGWRYEIFGSKIEQEPS